MLRDLKKLTDIEKEVLRRGKEGLDPLTGRELLEGIISIPVVYWAYLIDVPRHYLKGSLTLKAGL